MSERNHERDAGFMRMAIDEAQKAIPSPNPSAGAVVVTSAGQVAGIGHQARAEDPHANRAALAAAKDAAKGATLYVTLEPCSSLEGVPPCVDAIAAAGIKRVVIGCLDPTPGVEGSGAERLAQQGIAVTVGVCEAEAKALIVPWTTFITTGIPHVLLKLALSLDGRIATRSGASKWVTGPEARIKVQELRARCDAVSVGVGTAIADDPLLTVRDVALPTGQKPRRVIFDSQLRLSLHSRLVATTGDTPTIILTTVDAPGDNEQALLDAGCEVYRVPPSAEGRVDMESGLRQLAGLGIVSLLVEGGAELAGSLLATRFAHEMHAFVAPILLGPRGRPGAVDWAGPDTPGSAPRILDAAWELCGRDAYVFGPLVFPEKQ